MVMVRDAKYAKYRKELDYAKNLISEYGSPKRGEGNYLNLVGDYTIGILNDDFPNARLDSNNSKNVWMKLAGESYTPEYEMSFDVFGYAHLLRLNTGLLKLASPSASLEDKQFFNYFFLHELVHVHYNDNLFKKALAKLVKGRSTKFERRCINAVIELRADLVALNLLGVSHEDKKRCIVRNGYTDEQAKNSWYPSVGFKLSVCDEYSDLNADLVNLAVGNYYSLFHNKAYTLEDINESKSSIVAMLKSVDFGDVNLNNYKEDILGLLNKPIVKF